MRLRHFLLSGLGLLPACGNDPPKTDATTSEAAVATSADAPVSAASQAPPPVDRSPIKGSLEKARLQLVATKFEPDRLEDRLTMWLQSDRPLNLHPFRGAMWVSYAGVMAELKGNELAVKYLVIFPEEAYTVLAMGGSYPENVQARVYFDSWASPGYQRQAPIKETQTHTFINGKLKPLGLASDAPLKIAGWKGGNGLKLEKGSIGVLGSGEAPKQQPAPEGAPCKGAALTAEEIDALPSGEVFLLGKRCGQGAYAAELIAADGKSVIEDLPDAPSTAKRGFISAGSTSRAYVVISTGTDAYIATWDGSAMRRLELEATGDVTSVWTSPDGTLFFLLIQKGRAELWRVMPNGAATKSGVFAPSPNAAVWASDKDTAYVPSFRSLLSTKPGLSFTGYATEKDPNEAANPGIPFTGLPRFTDDCTTPFVWLFDVSEVAGPDFTFPNTRGALSSFPKLAEITLVEIKVGSGRKLGVVVPSKAVGEEVVAQVRKHMKDENPGLACYKPADDARVIKVK